ncbi:AI-2E family transporter [Deinococcus sp.]|uniref:AI-2E family transporter n=1 Tax=Deinococcus sp. TaxID=47478 RepID=UPI0025B8AE56|nr:AI-2E family transporter [Deinococcus sp.]
MTFNRAPLPKTPQTVADYLGFLWTKPWVRLLFYGFLLWLAWRTLQFLTGIVVMIGAAYAVSYVLNPLLNWLQSRGLRRGWSITLLLIVFLGITGLLFWTVASQVTNFIAGIPGLLAQLPTIAEKQLKEHSDIPAVAHMQGKLMTYLNEKVSDMSANLGPIVASVLDPHSYLMGRLAGVLGGLGQAVVILTLAVFFMSDHARPGRMLLGLLPRYWQPPAVRLADDVSESFGNYLRGQLLTGAAITLIAGGGLLLLKVPNALALGLLTGIFGLIPMFGMILATVPVLLQAIAQGTTTVLWVCALYFLINQVAFNFVQPMIMGRTSNLTPAGILIAVLVGGAVGGLGGAFLAIPAAMLLQRWVTRYWLHSPAHEGLPPQLQISRPEEPLAESGSGVTANQN